jgi:hypothetical protein
MIGYRYGAWAAPRAASAGNVACYEQDDLGNDRTIEAAIWPHA